MALPVLFSILIVDAVIASLLYPVFSRYTDGLRIPEFWFGVAMFAFSFFQFLAAPALGALSDRKGRRPVFRLAAIGTFASMLLLLPVRYLLFFGNRVVDGTTNGLYPVVKSAIVDLSPKKDMQRNVGLSTTISYVGLLFGPAVAAGVLWLAKRHDLNEVRSLVVAGMVFAALNIVLSTALPETKRPAKKHRKPKADHGPLVTTAQASAEPASETSPDSSASPASSVSAVSWASPDSSASSVASASSASSVMAPSVRQALHEISPVTMARRLRRVSLANPTLGRLIALEGCIALCTGYYTYFVIFVAKGPLQLDARSVAYLFLYFAGLGIVTNTIFFAKIARRLHPVPTLRVLFLLGIVTMGLYAATGDRLWMLYVALTVDMTTLSLVPGLLEGLVGKEAHETSRGEVFGLAQGVVSLLGLFSIAMYTVSSLVDLRLPFLLFALPLVGALFVLKDLHLKPAAHP